MFVQRTDDSTPFSCIYILKSVRKVINEMTDDSNFMFKIFCTSKCDCVVLKALEKSKNISRTELPPFSKCEYIFSNTYKTASSVLLVLL